MQKLRDILSLINGYFLKQHNIFALFIILLILPNCFLAFADEMTLAMISASIFIPLGMYMLLMSIFRRPGVIMIFLLSLIFLSCIQYVIIYLFGASIIASDMFLNFLIGNSGEANELLTSLLPMIFMGIVITILSMWLAYRSITIKNELSMRRRKNMLGVAISFLLIGLLSAGVQRYNADDDYVLLNIYPVNVFHNMKLAMASMEQNNNYMHTSQFFQFDAEASHDIDKREIYVMVVGETSRASSWGLYGYHRQTTPELSQLDSLVVFSDVTAVSNTTFKCVPMLITPAGDDNYNDIFYQKSIITAFKEAGFKTCYYSNQAPTGTFIDYYALEADTSLYLNVADISENHPYDHELLPYLYSEIKNGHENLFVILHTYGSHFSYSSRYMPEFREYTPDEYTGLDFSQHEALVNAYDNSVLATDNFLWQIIELLKESGAVSTMLYVSDHGEDLMDDRHKRSLHSSPNPSYYQLHVPMILWMSNSYVNAFPGVYRYVKNHANAPISTTNIFHTVVDIAGIKTKYLKTEKSVVNPEFKVSQRAFIDDHNKARNFDDCGLKQEDKELFLKQGLQFP